MFWFWRSTPHSQAPTFSRYTLKPHWELGFAQCFLSQMSLGARSALAGSLRGALPLLNALFELIQERSGVCFSPSLSTLGTEGILCQVCTRLCQHLLVVEDVKTTLSSLIPISLLAKYGAGMCSTSRSCIGQQSLLCL